MRNHDRSRLYRLAARLALILAGLLLAGCNYPGLKRPSTASGSPPGGELSLAEALAVTPEDRRPAILAEMGAPDAFSISFDTLNGQVLRSESWSYFDYGQRLDFIDGELLWTVELEPLPDGALYAHFYTPEDFSGLMSSADGRELLAGQAIQAIDLAEGGAQGGLLLAGDQILLGFEQDRLVYVETLVLAPDGSTLSASPLPEPTPAPAGAASGAAPAPANGALILQDDFEGGQPLPAVRFPPDFMSFEHEGGKARLESKFDFLPASVFYDLPPLQDFIAEFDLYIHELAPGAEAGLTFRGDDQKSPETFYALVLRAGENQIGLRAYQNEDYVTWDYKPVPQELLSPDGAYHLRLEVEGSSVRVYLNGGLAAAYSDEHIPQAGFIGLSLFAPQTPQVVYFDNLSIYQIP